ncbi:lysine histidine transporter 1-like [Zingiber officinale]|uniref:lysine histidine transporter 1-like n=2 Tax=Zingiber officinale TaxID=94328 RepID=UPI001C4D7AA2|nr:lysine histidine transporter 1-like [Zingiber officinale]
MLLDVLQTYNEKSIDDWLPITSSRNAKWWYSAFHNVTAMVGAGVLSLPYALAQLGWGPGITVLVISWIITLYTLWQMVEMHEVVPGKRFDRYHELGQHAFGEKLGLWIVVPQQLIVEVGVNIVYMVTGGKSLKKFHDLVCPDCKSIKLTYFIMIFGSCHFVLSQLPNLNSISGVSLAAAVMSLSYSTIAWAGALHKGKQENVDFGYKASTTSGTVFNFFAALGDVAFAYAGHNVVLEIQATIPSTPEKPSKKPMWKGVVVAYIVVAICYFPVALIGYWAFGNTVEDNILITLEKPSWLIAIANMFVVIHVVGSYQIYAMPVFDMIETVLVKSLKFRPSLMLRLISRSVYVAFTMFIAIVFPFFGGLLGFFGGFAFAPTTYFLPCVMWLAIYKPRRFSLSWFTNWICIILGVFLMILSPIGGLRLIIIQAKNYSFFS